MMNSKATRHLLLLFCVWFVQPTQSVKTSCFQATVCYLEDASTTVNSTELGFTSYFSYFTIQRMRTLKFINSSLLVFPTNLFVKIPALLNVTATHSNLENIDSIADGSSRKTDLKILDLSHNKLSVLAGSAFLRVNKLTVLDLSFNRISNISASTFYGLTELQELVLSNNLMKSLPEFLFQAMPALKKLQMNHNQMTSLDIDQFKSNKNLFLLSMKNNKIATIDVAETNRVVNTLYLSGNNLEDISNLTMTKALKTLYLADNPSLQLDQGTFQEMSQLYSLILDNTNLQQLDSNYRLFENLQDLTLLSLASNNLDRFAFSQLPVMRKVEYFYIDDNNLTSLDFEVINTTFPKLQAIEITKNGWDCLFLKYMIEHFDRLGIRLEFFEHSRITDTSRYSERGIECFHKGEQNERAIRELNNEIEELAEKLLNIEDVEEMMNATIDEHKNLISSLRKRIDTKFMDVRELSRDMSFNQTAALTALQTTVKSQLKISEDVVAENVSLIFQMLAEIRNEQVEGVALAMQSNSSNIFLWLAVLVSLAISIGTMAVFYYKFSKIQQKKSPDVVMSFSERNSQCNDSAK